MTKQIKEFARNPNPLPVSTPENSWRLSDTGFIIERNSTEPLKVSIIGFSYKNGMVHTATVVAANDPSSYGGHIDKTLRMEVPIEVLFKTKDAALRTMGLAQFEVTMTKIGTVHVFAKNTSDAMRMAESCSDDSIQWDSGTVAATDAVAVPPGE